MKHSFEAFRQLDSQDCGPTCLQMIAKHHGRFFRLNDLRQRAYISKAGVSMRGISEAAESIGMRTIGIRIQFHILKKDVPLPCIVHWYQRHFIVVYKTTKETVYVADPAAGKLQYNESEFKKGWLDGGSLSGVALLLEPTEKFFEETDDNQAEDLHGITYFFDRLKNHRKLILQLVLGFLGVSIIQMLLPLMTQSVVDVGIGTRNTNFVYLIFVGMFLMILGRSSIEFIRRWILLHLSTRINISIISEFLLKLFKLPMSFFESRAIGDILRRIEDHSRIERFLSTTSLGTIFSLFSFVAFSIILLTYSFRIFAIFALFTSLYFSYILLFMKRRGELDYKRFQELAENQTALVQSIQGMAEIKLNNCQSQKRWEWERIQAKLFKLSIQSTRIQQYQDAGEVMLNESKNLLLTLVATLGVINGDMTLGMMLSVQYIVGALNSPINDFINLARDWQDARISLQRIGEVKQLPMEEDANDGRLNDIEVQRAIFMKSVSFKYDPLSSYNVLNNIDLTIPIGKTTAIVGSSGSGKTTLIKLLLKFYRPMSGRILLDEIDINNCGANWWRGNCGSVMQDGYIFPDSIARNVALSEEDIDYAKVHEAMRMASIHEFVQSLPLGVHTKIGMNGTGLSHGQKQRLLIARAVYKNPKFLFLDEATSSLDANNERLIQENLVEFFNGRTVIIIAHRLSTVKMADQIVVMDKGNIVEIGSHHELIKGNGEYFKLIQNQLELGA